jgi:hypothetical protein
MIPWIKSAAFFTAVAAICAATAGGAGAAGSNAPSASTTRSAANTAAATRAALLRHADFSTIAGAKAYFSSIGVNPRGVVIQRGVRNYAGPRCPGGRWACTKATHPVVQIAVAGGRNRFLCKTARCAVVQLTGRAATTRLSLAAPAAKPNKAVCIKTMGLTQSCSISQSSATADNTAVVYQNAGKLSGLTQTASSSASITQRATGSSNKNTACVLQATTIDGSTVATKGMPVTVTLESHQSVQITQDSKGSAGTPPQGGNSAKDSATSSGTCGSAPLTQTQTLTSTATGSGAITQNQNAADNGPNMLLDIEQNQGAGFLGVAHGPNNVDFTQTNRLTAIANTSSPVGPVNQTQSSSTGGIQAMVNQDSRDISTAIANQRETQCEDAFFALLTTPTTCDTATPDPPGYSLTQTQFGPIGNRGAPTPAGQRTPMKVTKGPCPPDCATQTGNDDDTFTITQTTQQDNDTGENQSNNVLGDCTSDGNCTVTQSATVNGETTTNTQSGQDVNTQTTCTGSDCTTTGPTTTGTLTLSSTGFSVANTDVAEFGTGGMRGGDGTGTINVSDVTAPVLHALLFWHGPTNSSNPAANASVTFNGTPITGANIGVDSDNNWGFQNSQAYRADVTGLVTGDGSYSLSNFRKPGPPAVDINGVSLLVFYDDGNSSNDRNVVAWNGNDSNGFDFASPSAWNETIPGVPYPGSGSASLVLIVGDGQSYNDGEVRVKGTPIANAGPVFQGDVGPNYSGNPSGVTGSLWDMKSYDITSLLTEGANDLTITSPGNVDALSLVVAMANVPAAGPIILAAPTTAVASAPTRTPTTAHSRSSNRRGGLK